MSLRTTAALALLAALAALAAALVFRDARTALAAAVAAVAGACAARLLAAAGRGGERSLSVEAPRGAARADGTGGVRAANNGDGLGVPPGELVEAMIDSLREGLVVVDAVGRVIVLNAAARELFAAPAGRARTRRGPELLSDLTRDPAVIKAFAAAVERGERVEAKVETAGPDGRAFDLRVAPLGGRPGAAGRRGAIGLFFDITRLERLERVRQEFLSNVSHELRTPLTAIRAFVETLDTGAIDEPEHNRRFLSIIDRNAARMHNLIDDILELSAIEAGTVAVEPQPVPLRPLVEDVVSALASRAEARRVALGNYVPSGVTVRADPRRLEQMLTNLLDNAVKFSREGGGVRVHHERSAGRDRISITDSGDGIAPEHLPRIFERFYRVDRARSRELGGTGLGLAIVKHLARAHGGEATVRSAAGQGSIFTVELPQHENDE